MVAKPPVDDEATERITDIDVTEEMETSTPSTAPVAMVSLRTVAGLGTSPITRADRRWMRLRNTMAMAVSTSAIPSATLITCEAPSIPPGA